MLGQPRQRPGKPLVNWHEGGSGSPLLLLNGFTGSGLAWPGTWLRRLEAQHRVIRIDNRGTGWSRDAPAPFSIADMADDARDVLDACGIDRAVVLGFSMGGMIAQELAVRHPERVAKLVLVATTPPIPALTSTSYGVALASMLCTGHQVDVAEPSRTQLDQAAGLWLKFAAKGFQPAEGVVDEMGHQALRRVTPRRAVFMQARAINSWRHPRRITGISVPTVVVHGAAERVIPVDNARQLAQLIPGSELVELEGVGHLVPWEAEEALAGMVEE